MSVPVLVSHSQSMWLQVDFDKVRGECVVTEIEVTVGDKIVRWTGARKLKKARVDGSLDWVICW